MTLADEITDYLATGSYSQPTTFAHADPPRIAAEDIDSYRGLVWTHTRRTERPSRGPYSHRRTTLAVSLLAPPDAQPDQLRTVADEIIARLLADTDHDCASAEHGPIETTAHAHAALLALTILAEYEYQP